MLFTTISLNKYKLVSTDGELGVVKDFYFDDRYWTIRYLVADEGNWIFEKQVLLSPYAISSIDKNLKHILVSLTKKQIEASPALATNKPVSKQFENYYYSYYGWPIYWTGPYVWGNYPNITRDPEKWKASHSNHNEWDANLRSTKDVTGHFIEAIDGDIGHVEGFIVDDLNWEICYMIVDTTNLWPGKKVLISPKWIKDLSWSQLKVFVNLTCEQIKHSPEYTDIFLLTREYEIKLHEHYNLKGYWVDNSDI